MSSGDIAGELVVIGAGGHGKVVADILLAAGYEVAGFLDDRLPVGLAVLGKLSVLGTLDWLGRAPCRVALGIGDNAIRARVADRVLGLGSSLFTAVHPRAVVAASALIGDGVAIMATAVINPCASIETGAIINTGVIVEHDCVVSAFAHISPNATLGGECHVGAYAHVGIAATMLPRTAVGARSLIGGGAVVVRDIPADVVAVGMPARVTRGVTEI